MVTATATATYKASTTKRKEKASRRTKADMVALRDAIFAIVGTLRPVTVRQVYYQLVSKGLVRKTESEYNNAVCRVMVDMRREGRLPYSWVADNTRWMRKPKTYNSMEDALRSTALTYRRALWEDQDVYVEIWCEKDALAGVIMEETRPYDVPLMVGRGYSSDTYLNSCAEAIKEQGKPAYLYYFGDHDPSGRDIERVLIKKLREFAPEAEIHFERVAVTLEQIERMELPTRETKRTDTRARNFTGASVDVDALSPTALRTLARDCIERHIDFDVLDATRRTEDMERETLARYVGAFHGRSNNYG